MHNSISIDQLKTEQARLSQAREQLRLNLAAHDGALQAVEQLILIAENPPAKQSPAAIVESDESGHRDQPASGQPGASQKT